MEVLPIKIRNRDRSSVTSVKTEKNENKQLTGMTVFIVSSTKKKGKKIKHHNKRFIKHINGNTEN